jgi:predicted nucleic acid-binding protein
VTALLDTSVFIGHEHGRLTEQPPPGAEEVAVSVVTVGELRLGVHMASTPEARARRLATLRTAESMEPVEIDNAAAAAWAQLLATLRKDGRRMPVNDSWIAATALSRGYAVVTQDADYDVVPGLETVRI